MSTTIPSDLQYILLASDQCFAIPSDSIEKPNLENVDKLKYELERFLPFDAEELLVASLNGRSFKRSPLILAASKLKVEEHLKQLPYPKQWISCISPEPLILVQFWLLKNRNHSPSVIYVETNRRTISVEPNTLPKSYWDAVTLKRGNPESWEWIDEDELVRRLEGNSPSSSILLIDQPTTSTKYRSLNRVVEQLHSRSTTNEPNTAPIVTVLEVDLHELRDSAMDDIRNRRWLPWFDFKRHAALANGAGHPLLRSTLFGLSCLTTVLWGATFVICAQIFELRQESETVRQTHISTFSQEFPKQSIPVDIPGRMRSELRKLEDNQTQFANVPQWASALPLLVSIIDALPDEAIFRWDQILVNPQRDSSLTGAVKDLSDFEAIRNSLQKRGFQFSPPGTTQLADGYSIKIERLRPPDPLVTKAPVPLPSEESILVSKRDPAIR
jgi:hypothetical protein